VANIRRKNGSKRWTATIRVPQDIRSLNPSFIQKKDGKPKSLLEKALGTQDERLALKLAYDFEREMDAKFEAARQYNQHNDTSAKLSSENDILEYTVKALHDISKQQEENPVAIQEWLRAKLVSQLKQTTFSPADPRVARMFERVSKGWSEELSDSIIDLVGATTKSDISFETLADIERYKAKAKDNRVSVGVIFERYIRKRVADGPIKASTIKRARNTFKDLCQWLPFGEETAAESISVAKAREWVADYQLRLQQQDKSLTTVTNNIDSITPAFNKAVDDELITRNPFRKYSEALYKTKRGIRANQSNKAWVNDELSESALTNLIIAAEQKFNISSKAPSHKIMLPLIGLALYTGARIEELCRLTVNDIKTRRHLGIRYIDLDEAKSEAGVREIPLLPIAEKIVDYLVSRSKSSTDYLFANLPVRDDRRSHSPSNEFSRFKKGLGYTRKNEYTFHSFRSTVITLLDRADVPDGYISMMVGHVEGRNTLAKKTYSAGKELKALKEQVSCISYDKRIEEILLNSLK